MDVSTRGRRIATAAEGPSLNRHQVMVQLSPCHGGARPCKLNCNTMASLDCPSANNQQQCAHLLKVAGAPGEWQGAYLLALAPVVALRGLDVGLAVDARPWMRVLVLVLLFLVPGVEVAPALQPSGRCADNSSASQARQTPPLQLPRYSSGGRQYSTNCSPSQGHPFTARQHPACELSLFSVSAPQQQLPWRSPVVSPALCWPHSCACRSPWSKRCPRPRPAQGCCQCAAGSPHGCPWARWRQWLQWLPSEPQATKHGA